MQGVSLDITPNFIRLVSSVGIDILVEAYLVYREADQATVLAKVIMYFNVSPLVTMYW